MRNNKKTWFYILAAIVTIIGFVTGWYYFFILALPLGIFSYNDKDKNRQS
ncbi:hypothetical protein [Salinimicrobium oceani]|uniref:Uncharacterized protein n=1 Tax=Salinimicrobium oceani TaxID=2722702 RepID=A0ABX1CYX6_9FLAO|nr:hypothetical protein [Salinimicrobium oceani]NJW53466.1 hypothetical protein [Salinimicrobium oceani]